MGEVNATTVSDDMVNDYKRAFQVYLDELPARSPVNFSWYATRAGLEAVIGPTLAAKDAEIERLREARDLIADWIIEGTEDLPDDTPVTIKIGSRSIIYDELKNLRAAVSGGKDHA